MVAVQPLLLPSKELRVRGCVYCPELLLVMDEYLNWSMFALPEGKQLQEVTSSRELTLFGPAKELTNKVGPP